MSLNSALVDRARVIQKTDTGRKVEGTTILAPVAQAWFKVRLELPGASGDTPDSQQGGRRRIVRTPSMLAAPRDANGDLVELRSDVYVEVASPELGTQVWRVNGEPKPMRKKRTVIGWEVELERVVERKMETL